MTRDKVWFITGASRGFGELWAEAALERGDSIAATARNTAALSDLQRRFGDAVLAIELDVTNRSKDFAAIAEAHSHFGRIDIVVNNAGYGHFGCIEELTEQDARDQLETNFFGALWITQAALPYLRAQRSGHIVQVSSLGGLAALPDAGIYHASKFALEAISEALAQEVTSFGINVTLLEPGLFATDWAGSSSKRSGPFPAYERVHDDAAQMISETLGAPGDPHATVGALLSIVDAQEPPLRMLLGSAPLTIIKAVYQDRLKTWQQWESIAVQAQA
jgi:NAD(P)-dependent dehydrogenase (short-subunit alcohol dehydrogenase family)